MQLTVLLLLAPACLAYLPSSPLTTRRHGLPAIRASAVEESAPPTSAAPPKLKRERYVATNRFTVRDGKDAKFEKRW